MLHQRMPGQCGVHVFHHEWTKPFSIANIKASLRGDPFDGACVMFSGNNQDPSPGEFATWLRGQGEIIKMSKWIANPRHQSQIRLFRWEPSQAFRTKVQKAVVTA